MLFAILNPLNMVPDEEAHVYRAYDISLGHIISPISENGDADINMPVDYLNSFDNYKQLKENLDKKTDYTDTKVQFTGAQGYNAIMYIPTSIILLIARCIGMNILKAIYLARIINFAIFVFTIYHAIKIIPFGKLLLFAYMFTPMVLHQVASVSADSSIITFTIFFIAYSIYLIKTDNPLNRKQTLLYLVLSIFLGLAKYVYMPIIGLSILMWKNKKLGENRKNIIIIGIVIAIVLSAFSYFISSQYMDTRERIVENNVNPTEQIKFILFNPIQYLKILSTTIYYFFDMYTLTTFGYLLGLLNIKISMISIWVMVFLIIIAPFLEENKEQLNRQEKIWINMVTIVCILLVMTGLYLIWTPVGYGIIDGVQGRYFIPIFILSLLTLVTKGKYIKFKNTISIYAILITLINLFAIEKIIEYFIN